MEMHRLSLNFALALLAVPLVSCSNVKLKNKLNELNGTIDDKEYYNQLLEERMDSAREGLRTSRNDSLAWESAYELFSNYSYTCVDSARKYLGILEAHSTGRELKNRLTLCEARYLSIAGSKEEMKRKLAGVDPDLISDSFRNNYYNDLQRCYAADGEKARAMNAEMMRKAITFPGLDEGLRLRYIGMIKHFEGDDDSAIDEYQKCYEVSDDYHIKALVANNIAGICKRTNRELYKYWLAEAAINDLKVPVKDYVSLYNLSLALFEDNELKLASRFMKVVLNDALSSQYSDRIQNSAKDYTVIVEALDYGQRARLKTIMRFILILLVLMAVIMVLLIRQNRQKRNLARFNSVILELNGKLSDANKIKDNYLFRYMNLSVKYLGQVNEMKHQMRKVLKEGGPDALISMVRQPSSHDGYKDFYRIFDETFLSIYPHFTEQVNALLQDGLQFENKSPLSMELRILAAIRLGFTDSGKIAEFLNCAPNSVYTNRSKLKRFAKCERDIFEEKIKSLN